MALLRTKTVDFGSGQRVGYVRSLSRKRILVRSASLMEDSSGSDFDFDFKAMKKKREDENKSVLESLPLDVLIKVITFVNHEDLTQLFQVSKIICQAAKVAKEFHFAFATPTKVPAFKIPISPGKLSHNEDEIEAPNAPLRNPGRRRFSKKDKAGFADLAVALFGSDTDNQ